MIKRIFITGLAAIIPIVITIYVITALFTFADSILGKFINKYLHDYIGYTIPGLGIILSILIIFGVGLIVHISRMRIFRWMRSLFYKISTKLPLVNKVYFPVKKIVDFLFYPPTKAFKTAVLVEYPRKGIYSLGFITNENTIEFEGREERKYYNVFVSSSPSPLTGFTIIVEEKDIVFLDMTVERALKLVISGGLINPDE
jgi:uncharacterized membrane protein